MRAGAWTSRPVVMSAVLLHLERGRRDWNSCMAESSMNVHKQSKLSRSRRDLRVSNSGERAHLSVIDLDLEGPCSRNVSGGDLESS